MSIMATVLVILAVAVITYFDIKYLVKHGLDACTGDCTTCGTSCKWVDDMKRAQRKIAFERKLRKFFHVSEA